MTWGFPRWGTGPMDPHGGGKSTRRSHRLRSPRRPRARAPGDRQRRCPSLAASKNLSEAGKVMLDSARGIITLVHAIEEYYGGVELAVWLCFGVSLGTKNGGLYWEQQNMYSGGRCMG